LEKGLERRSKRGCKRKRGEEVKNKYVQIEFHKLPVYSPKTLKKITQSEFV